MEQETHVELRPLLVGLLAPDVVLYSDGGKVVAARCPIVGPDRVARFLAGVNRPRFGELALGLARVNGRPGVLARDREGRLVRVTSLDVAQGRIQTIRAVLNPDKLRHLRHAADPDAV